MTDTPTLIEFPCDFSIKIIGLSSENFIKDVTAIVLKHYPNTLEANIIHKDSEKGNYTAITATVLAYDKPSLDALYHDLTHYPGMKMVL